MGRKGKARQERASPECEQSFWSRRDFLRRNERKKEIHLNTDGPAIGRRANFYERKRSKSP